MLLLFKVNKINKINKIIVINIYSAVEKENDSKVTVKKEETI